MARESARTFLSRSPAATRALGERLGRHLIPGTVVALEGELGSGKTCFVQGLARGLGVPDRVTSPTYALLQSYVGRLDLHHFDAYMEGRERALLQDGGLEWMHGSGVAAVEWAGRVADVLPHPLIRVRMEHVNASARRLAISVEGTGASAARLAEIVERELDHRAIAECDEEMR